MKLSHVVAGHGFIPSGLGVIDNAKLYQRLNDDGVLELLCVQKIGNAMRVDRQPLIAAAIPGMGSEPMFLPIGKGLSNQMIPTDKLEHYLNSTLAAA